MTLLRVVGPLLVLAACADGNAAVGSDAFAAVEPGMTKREVARLLGPLAFGLERRDAAFGCEPYLVQGDAGPLRAEVWYAGGKVSRTRLDVFDPCTVL